MSRALKKQGYAVAAKLTGNLWTGRVRKHGLQIAVTQPYFTKPDALAAARYLVAKIESRNRATS